MTSWQWISQADNVTRGTAVVLLLMSVISWVLILYKTWWLARAQRGMQRATAAFWQADSWEQARAQLPLFDRAALISRAVDAIENIVSGVPATQHSLAVASGAQVQTTRVLREALQAASRQLQWGQTVLATIGATAPFVGLLGTVWGIHQALAVLAYNLLGRKGGQVEEELEGFAHDMQTWALQQFAQSNTAEEPIQRAVAAIATVAA